MQPTIICPWDYKGAHGERVAKAEDKILKTQYQDQSILAITPTRSMGSGLSPKWVSAMNHIMRPMNQKFAGPGFVCGMEIGDAYNHALKMIFSDPKYAGFKYMLTWEDDVIPEPDTLIELLAVAIETDADVTGALYWSKGEGGFPMIYGDVNAPEINFRVVHPNQDRYIRTYGTGMGFTLFKLDQFKKYFPELEDDWFKTEQKYDDVASKITAHTQDLYYMEKLVHKGGTVVVAQHAKCGHYDAREDVLW